MRPSVKRYILTGAVTAIPVLVTVFVFSFFLDLLSHIGRPKLVVLSNVVEPVSPTLADWLLEIPWLSSALAILLTLGMFYLLGWSMTRLLGRQMLRSLDGLFHKIPLVATVYGASKKLIDALQKENNYGKQVVLIAFPHERMKAVGIVTRCFTDEETGEQLAAVYVPTAPNPTGGYLEIVPVGELVPLDWTFDQAMAFVLSGGTTAPDRMRFRRAGEAGPGQTGAAMGESAGPACRTGTLTPPSRPAPVQVGG